MIRRSVTSSLEKLQGCLSACNAKQQGGNQAKQTVVLEFREKILSIPLVNISSDNVLLVSKGVGALNVNTIL